MNLPNKLTMSRILLIPVFMVVLYWGFPGADYVALAIFIVASLTDLLDGKIARKYNLVTDFGKFADPLADKMLVTAALLWFVEQGRMSAWMLLIVICREFAVSGLRMIAADKGIVIAAGWSGKVKTAATMVCIAVMLFIAPMVEDAVTWMILSSQYPVPKPAILWVDPVCTWIITLTTIYSGVEYFLKNRGVIQSA
ncbi:MAG: CDP-diacylglycerol--glycerol-3-phosphate 3-phosphatidyltransferase [Oscillibacter sp.]|jgi:CDP-diacylglycerol--glycerol-3-phosphate 3-phosphatidyltransferase|nr:CDP-diacylglycerol--glycerol-3-phosphate 3-phosphatidyltransferase [Oscillibacter sp.]MCI8689831.1 CDP-diacylglycerol--glycerol-3-phosphate 3-phosphatidyltransferase [Oscillibacter sp.]